MEEGRGMGVQYNSRATGWMEADERSAPPFGSVVP